MEIFFDTALGIIKTGNIKTLDPDSRIETAQFFAGAAMIIKCDEDFEYKQEKAEIINALAKNVELMAAGEDTEELKALTHISDDFDKLWEDIIDSYERYESSKWTDETGFTESNEREPIIPRAKRKYIEPKEYYGTTIIKDGKAYLVDDEI